MCRFKDALLILQKAELKVCDTLHIPEHHWQAIAVRVLRQRWVENAIVGNLRKGSTPIRARLVAGVQEKQKQYRALPNKISCQSVFRCVKEDSQNVSNH